MADIVDKLTKYPSFWLSLYGVGSAMVITTVAGLGGAVAAGSATGFFLLAGVFGYESLTRRSLEEKLSHRVRSIETNQNVIERNLLETRQDIDGLKEDMAETAQTLNREVHKILNQSEPAARAPANAMRLMQKSFERMGHKNRNFREDFMPVVEDLKAPVKPNESRTQKYKDMLRMVGTRQDNDDVVFENLTIKPVTDYSPSVISELISQAISSEKIEIFAQPIVKLPSRRLQYLELFARIRAKSGVYLTAENYRPIAENETRIEAVDYLLLGHTLETIRHDARRKIDMGYFLNISARCLKDKNYMADVIEFVRMRRDLASRLIFELQYDDIKNLTPACEKMISGLAKIGCQFSVDNVMDSNFNPDILAEKGFSFIKFRADKLMEMCSSSRGEMEVARMKSTLDKSRLTLVVERLETEHDLKELLDFEIDFGEGFLFGRPDLEMAYRAKRVA
jgi:cyclic-di-GMP phosphodiesterase TipF (flagellum assembly factor)